MQLRLLDAAHILPVGAEGSTDLVTNGICLSPTYHRAFDNGLIFLTPDLQMRVYRPKLKKLEAFNLVGGLAQFVRPLNRPIFLPANPAQRPTRTYIRQANAFRAINP
jgi:putative restriction endonuclease